MKNAIGLVVQGARNSEIAALIMDDPDVPRGLWDKVRILEQMFYFLCCLS